MKIFMEPSNEKNLITLIESTPLTDSKGLFMAFSHTDSKTLEAVGQALTITQVLNLFKIEILPKNSLAPLLVGITPETFINFLKNGSEENILFLKDNLHNEPLQHHLTLISHQLSQEITTLNQKGLDLSVDIDTLPVENDAFLAINQELESLYEQFKTLLLTLDKALQLAWISERRELITELSNIKEKGERSKVALLGHPQEGFFPSTGLFEKLKRRLESIFGEALNDNDPALDGLTQFSLWYPRDYWELGLLPHYIDSATVDQEDSSIILAHAKETLRKIGLQNVGDLKKCGIYSKRVLKEYILSKTNAPASDFLPP